MGVNPFGDFPRPTSRSFAYPSWPASIRPPAEGALDREQYRRLLERLAAFSDDGDHTHCLALYAECWDFDSEHLFTGTLGAARHQYDDPDQRGAPNNVWPADRSWFVYPDYDRWGTKVSGSERLIAWLDADPELETVNLD